MRPHSIDHNHGLRQRSQSIATTQNDAHIDNASALIGPANGIVRVRVYANTTANSDADKNSSDEIIKEQKDDDADSAISIENFDEISIDQKYPEVDVESNKSTAPENDAHRRPYQHRLSSVKRSSATAMNPKMKSRHEGDSKLNASGGSTALPTWKIKKAMKSFKMAKISTGAGPEADFGAPHIQYFLASLCDHAALGAEFKTTSSLDRVNELNSAGLKARCPLVAEVQKLVSKLRSSQPVNAQSFQLSVAVTVLKEFLNGIPGGVFGELTEEFYQISLESSLELTIMYLHSILHEMPYIVQQFTYLLCTALRNLVRLTGGSSLKNYTELLMHFTPVLFSSSIGDIEKFLRAARLLLVMVDNCERVFLPLPWLDANGHWCWHNGDFEDETFFRQIFDSLQNLEARLATDDSGVESEVDESLSRNHDQSPGRRTLSTSLTDFYQVVYLDDDS